MKLTNTACLAVLLLACPLAATAVHAADYYGKENSTPDESGKVAASGYTATLTNGSHEQIYIGYATLTQGSDAKELESSNNTGILSGGLDVASFWTRVWGGAAGSVGGEVATTSRANSNKLFLNKGWVGHYLVEGGRAIGSNDVEACLNEVTLDNVTIDGNGLYSLYGGDACIYSAHLQKYLHQITL